MLELSMKNFSPNFKATSRDRYNMIFRNKTDPPEFGKYNPSLNVVRKKERNVVIRSHWEFQEAARKRRQDLDFRNQHLCGSLVKSLFKADIRVSKPKVGISLKN